MTTKLQDPKTAAKTYGLFISSLLYKKKTPAIPPLLVRGKFVSDFREKANLFNNFFMSIYTPIKTKKVWTNARITSFDFTKNIYH